MKSWIRNLLGFFDRIIKRVALYSFKAKEVKKIYRNKKDKSIQNLMSKIIDNHGKNLKN